MPKLAEGVYEELLTERLAHRVATAVASPIGVGAELRSVSEIDLPQLLAKALAHEIERALPDAPDAAGQIAIAEEVLSAVAKVAPPLRGTAPSPR